MKKITILLITAMFTLTTSAFAGGMIGVKIGKGDLEGTAKSYTAGGTTYGAATGSKDNDFGAIFAEYNVMESPISVGLEYVPFDADVSLDGKSSGVSANVGDYTTLYALAMQPVNDDVSVYAKIGYSQADIGSIKNTDTLTTINSKSGELEPMYGARSRQPVQFRLVISSSAPRKTRMVTSTLRGILRWSHLSSTPKRTHPLPRCTFVYSTRIPVWAPNS
jgi:hypothetical protein